MRPFLNAVSPLTRLIGTAALLLGTATLAHATIISYSTTLSGPNESPPNASPATGNASAIYDNVAHTLTVHVDFTGLTGLTTASHIHAPTALPFTSTAGVATTTPTFAGFPLNVTAGTYDKVLDLTLSSSYNPTFVTNNGGTTASAEAALTQAIADGKAYLNVHTMAFPGGEIRGFLIPTPTPTKFETWGLIKATWH